MKCLYYGNGLEQPEWLVKNWKTGSGSDVRTVGGSSGICTKKMKARKWELITDNYKIYNEKKLNI